MQALYRDFKQELHELREKVEDGFPISVLIKQYQSSDNFRKQIIAYRVNEYFDGAIPGRPELLRLLSLWDISL